MLHPTLLQYVVLKCSDRLAGALPIAGTELTQPRGICAEQRRLKSQIIRYLRFHKSLVPFRMPQHLGRYLTFVAHVALQKTQ